MDNFGYCKFCGQYIRLDEDYGSETENNKEATWQCNCPPSRDAYTAFKKRKTQIESANESIASLFAAGDEALNLNPVDPEQAECAVSLLKASVEPIVDRLLYKMSMDIPGGVKVSISRSGKDKVSVERSDVVKRKMES